MPGIWHWAGCCCGPEYSETDCEECPEEHTPANITVTFADIEACEGITECQQDIVDRVNGQSFILSQSPYNPCFWQAFESYPESCIPPCLIEARICVYVVWVEGEGWNVVANGNCGNEGGGGVVFADHNATFTECASGVAVNTTDCWLDIATGGTATIVAGP